MTDGCVPPIDDPAAVGDGRRFAGDDEWIAVCYVLGELPRDEAAAFERRLAVDPASCEALVRATRLVSTIAVASPAATAPEATDLAVSRRSFVDVPSRRRRRIAAAAVTTAALFAAAAAFVALPLVGPHDATTVAGDVDPARLAAIWSQSAAAFDALAFDVPAESAPFDLSDDASSHDAEPIAGSEPQDAVDGEFTDVLLPPDWMLAAVEVDGRAGPFDATLDGDDSIERN